jgi:hypothetical protein
LHERSIGAMQSAFAEYVGTQTKPWHGVQDCVGLELHLQLYPLLVKHVFGRAPSTREAMTHGDDGADVPELQRVEKTVA